jgi:hypothetical protein
MTTKGGETRTRVFSTSQVQEMKARVYFCRTHDCKMAVGTFEEEEDYVGLVDGQAEKLYFFPKSVLVSYMEMYITTLQRQDLYNLIINMYCEFYNVQGITNVLLAQWSLEILPVQVKE